LGKWLENTVAKCWTRGRCHGQQVRHDLMHSAIHRESS
jgi:hypothetical protein